MAEQPAKDLLWTGDSRRRVKRFPDDVREEVGHALYVAECGGKHPSAKALKGYGGASVVEIVGDSENGNTYRLVYTVEVPSRRLRPSRLREKVDEGDRDAEAGPGPDRTAAERGRGTLRQGVRT